MSVIGVVAALPARAAGPDGAELFQRSCAICHGAEGRGVPGAFPPLAGSSFIKEERERALKAPLEGLFDEIVVNGQKFKGGMPPVLLNDEQLAAVFGYVFTSWGNQVKPPTADEIAKLRAASKYKTFTALVEAMGTTELPDAPDGWELKIGVELTFSPVRVVAHPDGESVLILADSGDVWQWRPDAKADPVKAIEATSYIDYTLGRPSVVGMTFDAKGRLYLVGNQQNKSVTPVRNEVTIFRTPAWAKGGPLGKPAAWVRTSYPWGVGPYNHGVSTIGQGPDGKMYVNSGSRTDGGEPGNVPNYSTKGEEPNTACIWRIDPEAEKPEIEVIARGVRNSFGFTWDDRGHMVATDNGPDAHAPEELNLIEPGKHYGFPFQFSNWTKKAYPYTPDAPAGLAFTHPMKNLGPDAGGSAEGLSTFDAHSSPAGIVWLDKGWPAPLGESFLVARYGNLLALKADVGFDVVQVKADFEKRTLSVRKVLAPLSRPIDLVKWPGHRLVIAEYTHGTTLAAGLGSPGRLLILAPAK